MKSVRFHLGTKLRDVAYERLKQNVNIMEIAETYIHFDVHLSDIFTTETSIMTSIKQ